MGEVLLDAAGRRRSPATLPGFHAGRPPRNKGRRYPADPPTVEEIVAVMRAAGDRRHGCRLRGLIIVLWRAGLRIHEALALNESDLDRPSRRAARPPRQGRPPPRVRGCAAPPQPRAFADASRPTSSATLTPSRWRTRACRSSSSNASL